MNISDIFLHEFSLLLFLLGGVVFFQWIWRLRSMLCIVRVSNFCLIYGYFSSSSLQCYNIFYYHLTNFMEFNLSVICFMNLSVPFTLGKSLSICFDIRLYFLIVWEFHLKATLIHKSFFGTKICFVLHL